MASSSTVYDVKVRYALDDHASGGLKSIAKHADKAHEGVFSLKHAIEALALKEVFHLGKEALIDFNSEMDKLKIGMTTVMQMNLHMPFEKASKEADKLFDTFQQMAKKSPVTTKDFMDMAAAIAPAVSGAGGGPDKLAKLTKGAITAGLAYGKDPQTTAMAISEMMMGNARKTNPLAMSLVASTGMDHNAFNQMDPVKRAQLVEKILTDPALDKAANRFGETLVGQTSTFKDNLQIALGSVGKPLMEAMTSEVKKWNEFLDKHPKLIKETVQELGGMIKDAFEFVKNAVSFLVENRDVILTIAKSFLVFKGGKLAGEVFKKFGDGLGSLTDSIKNGASGIKQLFSGGGLGAGGLFGALSSAATGVGMFVAALDLAGAALDLFAQNRKENLAAETRQRDIHEAVGEVPGLKSRQEELQGMLKSNSEGLGVPLDAAKRGRFATELAGVNKELYDPSKLGAAVRALSDESKKNKGRGFENWGMEDYASMTKLKPWVWDERKSTEENAKAQDEWFTVGKIMEGISSDLRTEVLKNAFPEQFGKPDMAPPTAPESPWGKGVTPPNVNITIQRIEVASEDPDRFVFGIVKMGEQATKHPTSSQHATPGGF